MATSPELVTLDSKKNVESKPKTPPITDRILDFLSSVKFGIVLLCILVLLSMCGMLIVQQNVQGFEAYFGRLSPTKQSLFDGLGLFDIYHSWYFNLILLVLSLNIVLASIERFPSAWSYISRTKLDASRKWLLGQKQNSVVELNSENAEKSAETVAAIFKSNGFKPVISEKKGTMFVFGEHGKWNRLGAYIVHVALLTLFLGHFVALQTGFDADVGFMPGQTTDEIELIKYDLEQKARFPVKLPFTINCMDIQQKLIDPNGSIEPANTLDWRTKIKIDDPQYGVTEADISLNNPFQYRGYRFFQAQTISVGNARTINLELTPEAENAEPITVSLDRNGSTVLDNGTLIKYESFYPDFTFERGQPDTKSGEYYNPVAALQVTPQGGEQTQVFAFNENIAENMPLEKAKVGFKWKLKEFEKVPFAHILSIKYDPYNGAFIAWYFGGFGLIFSLIFVFFFSHKRIWALIEKDEINQKFNVVLGGHTNRNHVGFENKFKKILNDLSNRANLD